MPFHLDEIGPDTPRLPEYRLAAFGQLAASALVHAAAALTIALVLSLSSTSERIPPPVRVAREPLHVDMRHMVFVAPDPRHPGSGGGGGGNRQTAPIRRAVGIGIDAITVRIRKPVTGEAQTSPAIEVPTVPSVVLDVKALASGTFHQIGLPTSNMLIGTSTGPGSGGGVGTGTGSGIGSGDGPGLGPGSGGGTGGGVFRPGGAVSAPKAISEVKPRYTSEALLHKVQGSVVLEFVVNRDGRPTQIHVIRSLDKGLDQEAVVAVMQWRFEPGRVAGEPVDVLVTAVLDFQIR